MDKHADNIRDAVAESLKLVEQDREREIISRRFGLEGNKETLEQIGELLNITRERVRQLEKAILIRLRIAAEEDQIEHLAVAEKAIVRNLSEEGRAARVSSLAKKIFGSSATPIDCHDISFLATICPSLTAIDENDRFHSAITVSSYGDEKSVRERVDKIVSIVSKAGKPITIDVIDEKLTYEHPDHIRALASISKQLCSLNDKWGLTRWPSVNPKNIRDKIFVILGEKDQPMHFTEIAAAIQDSNFHRKNVTTQAIHNELIKDPRFVLIGRGIYALDTWGFKRGTVSEIITSILKEAGEPLSREEIVKRVLKVRKVKETTILLNLQNRSLYEKVDRNLYTVVK